MPLTKVQSRGTENVGQGSSNVITNGAMNIAQRGASHTGLGGSTGAVYTLDRFCTFDSATAGRATVTQDSSAPSGFGNSLKVACTTADTSIASGEQFLLQQRIEGQNLQAFAKGTSDAKEFAVSFYVKGNASATYICELHDQDNGRQCSKTFSVTTDWTRIELIFPADTTGAFDDDNARSLNFNIALHAGSTYTSGTLNSSAFASTTNANRYVGGSSFFDSTSRTFFITGVQIEVGSQVSDFQHEDIGTTLAKCQRYFHQIKQYQGGGQYTFITGAMGSSNGHYIINHPVEMRSAPTIAYSGSVNITTNATSVTSPSSFASYSGTLYSRIQWAKGSNTAGDGAWVDIDDATFTISSEL